MTSDERTPAMEAADKLLVERTLARLGIRESGKNAHTALEYGSAELKAHIRGPYVPVSDLSAKPRSLIELLQVGDRIATHDTKSAFNLTDKAEKRSAATLAMTDEMRKQDEAMKGDAK